MQLPVDVKAVIDEATNIDEARNTPLSVSVYIDETAPGDSIACVRSAFASMSPQARVSMMYLDGRPFVPFAGDDMAVMVAGLSEQIGAHAKELRRVGVPVMVATTMPDLVQEISEAQGCAIPEGDVVSPEVVPSGYRALQEKVGSAGTGVEPVSDPYVLDEALCVSFTNRMGSWIIETCREKRLAFALAFPFVRRPLSIEAVNATAMQNAGVGLVMFIPGADLPIMTLNQAKMLLQIAAAYGEPMTLDRVKELAAVVGGAFVCRSAARQVVALIPALGWVIKAAIGYAGTKAMGCAAIEYFEEGGNIAGLVGVVAHARDKAVSLVGAARNFATGEAPNSLSGESRVQKKRVNQVARSAVRKAAGVARSASTSAVPFASSVVQAGAQAAGIDTSTAAKRAVQVVADVTRDRLKTQHP